MLDSNYVKKKNNPRPLYVLYQSDNNYVPILGISMMSLFQNNQGVEYLKVFVAEFKIKDESKDKLKVIAEHYGREIEFIDMIKIDAYLESTNFPKWRGSYAAYYKLFITQFLPDYVDYILYIDCDTIIARELTGIFEVDMYEHAIAMRGNVNYWRDDLKKAGAGDYYFNTGVILFNIQNWIKFDCEKILIQKARMPLPLLYADQDLLIISLPQYIQKLPFRYNVGPVYWKYNYKEKYEFYRKSEIDAAVKNPTIAHCFSGFYGRPWEEGNYNPYKKVWKYYCDMSLWKGFETKRECSTNERILYNVCRILPKPVGILLNDLLISVYVWISKYIVN